ncbi:hypothetical protein SELMODRAFT_423529 [Selaginella moellendorffii]|uniref:Uncharacterized protein n=1 Tax=Selaginella moellendorffii TaxID=88036 RepID=D8SM01_SELML|nr:uncharacterized protein At2g39910 [Selaginella moellendorffii]EFJ14400.1 hypothetical protein SELMODRAFT_423529 [Selaginella moellendorffii]|eukprot:XP_002984350.1 uncharacterized protein At2g39910 [Selaginella moellendorffii]
MEGTEPQEISRLLEALRVPRELTRSYASSQERDGARAEFLASSREALVALRTALVSGKWEEPREREVISTLATFACGEVEWTTDELGEIAVSAIDCLGSSRQQLVLDHLRELLLEIHASLRHGTREATAQSLYEEGHSSHDASNDIVLAHQMSWILSQIGHPHLGKHCQIIMPCVLTALDHYSPPIKRQGLECCLHLEQGMNSTELRWYKDVLLDAVCQNIAGCDELWPLVVKTAVRLVTRIEGRNARSPWYRKILAEMLGELERHPDDKEKPNVFLQEIGPQLKAMGLVLVALFKRLFALLFYWLDTGDKRTSILVLSCLRAVITHTWIRIPHLANSIWEQAVKLHCKVADLEVRAAVAETACYLIECVGPEILETHQDDVELVAAVKSIKAYEAQTPKT